MATSPASGVRTQDSGVSLSPRSFPDELKPQDPFLGPFRYFISAMTIREYTMTQLMNCFTDELGWEGDLFNEEFISKWRAGVAEMLKGSPKENEAEVTETDAEGQEELSVSDKMIRWCLAELQAKAELFKETGHVELAMGIVKSDEAISDDLRESLLIAGARLEGLPARAKGWRPGSRRQVHDLVDPFLYPLVWGQSKIVDETIGLDECTKRCGDGKTVPVSDHRPYQEVPGARSIKFQCLPSEFDIREHDVRTTSYINNLDYQAHKDLYSIIERIVSKTIPLWNRTMAPFKGRQYTIFYEFSHGRAYYEHDEYNDAVREYSDAVQVQRKITLPALRVKCLALKDTLAPKDTANPNLKRFEPLQKYIETYKRLFNIPPPLDLREEFGKLQIIVKLTNIYLTPDQPIYDGEPWHIAGQLNENICSTALYYYATENISEGLLSFRQQLRYLSPDTPLLNKEMAQRIFGADIEGAALQEIGSVIAKEGRLLTFSNIYQMRVQPLKLSDPSKSGHCKMLCLFLVNPHDRLISTANVPCQQKSLWVNQVRTIGPLGLLPCELADKVFDYIDFPVSLEVAKNQRLELMAERRAFVDALNEKLEHHNPFRP